jgi:hypothetical protein
LLVTLHDGYALPDLADHGSLANEVPVPLANEQKI